MEFSLPTAVLGAFFGSAVLASVMSYLARLPDAPAGLHWWTAAFALHTVRFGVQLLAPWMDPAGNQFLVEATQAVTAVLLLFGTIAHSGRTVRPDLAVLACLVVVVWAAFGTFAAADFLVLTVPLYAVASAAMIATGLMFLRGRESVGMGDGLVAFGFIAWGVHKLDYPFLRPVPWFAPIGFTISQVLSTLIAVGLIVVVQRRQQMLAEAADRRARFLTDFDPLTGLPNRRLFQERLEQAIALAGKRGEKVALLSVDLDRFKEINEVLGHTQGDALLKAVAQRLEGAASAADTVGRLSGDNFAVIQVGGAQPTQAQALAERVSDLLARGVDAGGQDIRLGSSIGIAVYPDDGASPDELARNADIAEAEAKRLGGNAFLFFADRHGDEVRRRLGLRQELHRAIERDEFELHYQPQFCCRENRVIGLEALLRWRHPERGLVLPGEFIPAAEESGLIADIGARVLERACAQNREWQEAGMSPLRVWVNISALQFRQRDLADAVGDLLERSRLPPHWLGLEITESTVMENVEAAFPVMRRLRTLGVEMAIDDFGTGYSNLSQLKRLPLDKLKVDQSFVRDLPNDSNDAAIVRGIIRLGQGINLRVLAEGVETSAQDSFLRAEGCNEVQGHLFGRPLPAGEVIGFLKEVAGGKL
jgi:diguanylate cyclase (GGDEF)-like protein